MYVESKVELNLPKSKILDLIREPGNLNKYHPFCKRNEAIKWPGNGSVDHLEYHNGMKFNREFGIPDSIFRIPNSRIEIRISRFQIRN